MHDLPPQDPGKVFWARGISRISVNVNNLKTGDLKLNWRLEADFSPA
jgi:hypothetical protein